MASAFFPGDIHQHITTGTLHRLTAMMRPQTAIIRIGATTVFALKNFPIRVKISCLPE
jgi:hypothetical protein